MMSIPEDTALYFFCRCAIPDSGIIIHTGNTVTGADDS